jgi:hypothetical protein
VREAVMKTYAQFDAAGRIYSVVTVDAPEGVRAMVDVEPGLSAAEIDTAEIKTPTTESEVEKIRALMQGYRVSVAAATKAPLTKAK